MKIALSSLLILLGFITAYSLVFAEEDMEKTETTTKEEKQSSEPKNNNSIEEFVPSEEVSIDKPVAFPVDI